MANASRCTVWSFASAVVVALAASSAEAQFVQCSATPSACRSAGHGKLVYSDRSDDADDLLKIRMKRVESTHWKRRLPTVAMVSPTAIGESYLRPVDY